MRLDYRKHGMDKPTLAQKLGMTVHLSPLLHKARRLGLGQRELEVLVVQRGCRHYSDGSEPKEPVATEEEFSNEELAMALLSICQPYDPHTIRCGAAMVGAKGNDPRRLAWLAKLERTEVPLRYVAEAGRKFEPANRFWEQLLAGMPDVPPPKPGVMPHPTRFVAMTGFTERGRELIVEWQRPMRRPEHALHG